MPKMTKSVSELPSSAQEIPKYHLMKAAQFLFKQGIEFVEPKKSSSDEIDLIFLHGSPNIYKDFDAVGKKEGFMVPPALNFLREEDTIKDALKESGQKILYQSKVATKDNFE